MHRPLWQIILTLVAIGFGIDRIVAAVMGHYAGAATGAVALQGVLAAMGLGAALLLWLWKGAKPEVPGGGR